jgi:Ice-binding-like
VVDPTTPPLVDPTTPPVVDPTTPAVISPVVAGAQAPVNLGAAGSFAVLAKSGITNVYASTITGNVGASPITGAAIDLTCPEVTGTIFTVDAAGPLPCAVVNATGLTAAVGDEETAYTDAAGRTNPDVVNLGAGEIGGLTLTPGLYKWGTDVSISNDLTLTGGPNDVWIFQIAGTLNEASAKNVTLAGGAQAKNVFWQVAGAATIGTTAHFEGTLLSQTMIAMNTGASTNGRLLAQTAVTLQMNTVTLPDMSVVTPPVVETTPPVVETTPPTVTDPPTATVTDPPTATVTDPPTATVTDPPTATVTDPPTVP